MTYLSNQELVPLVAAYSASGCVASASKILSNFENLIIGVIRRFAIRGSEEADLIQEANLEILRKVSKYDPLRGALSTYLQTVVETKLMTLYNKTAKQPATVSLDELDDREESVFTNILVATNNTEKEALQRLSRANFVERCLELAGNKIDQAIIHAIMDGRTDESVAKQLGICRVTVVNRRKKLLEKLRSHVNREDLINV